MRSSLTAVAIGILACASTRLTHVQVAPEDERAKVHNVLVVGLFKDPAARQAYERAMVRTLQNAGVRAQASQDALPIGAAPTRADVEHLVEAQHMDGAVVGQLAVARTSVHSTPAPVAPGVYGWYGPAAPMAYGALETSTHVVVQTRVFETATRQAEFSASSETIDPASAAEVAQAHAQQVVDALKESGIV